MNTVLLYALYMQHQPTGVHVALIIRCVSISIKPCVGKVLKVPPHVGWFSMSPLPRLHHHDVMTIVGLFMYRQYVIYIYTYHLYVRNVGALKVANLHCSR